MFFSSEKVIISIKFIKKCFISYYDISDRKVKIRDFHEILQIIYTFVPEIV